MRLCLVRPVLLFLFLGACFVPGFSANAESILNQVQGRILLQVEEHGEAWYVAPSTGMRYYMKDGDAAYEMMRMLSLGITDVDLDTIPSVSSTEEMLASENVCDVNTMANRLSGMILLQVQAHGEAWYVHPDTCKRLYLADGTSAYTVMRELSLGITNADLALVPEAEQEETDEVADSTTEAVKEEASEVIDSVPETEEVAVPADATDDISFYLYLDSSVVQQVEAWSKSRPEDAATLEAIASQPMARWFGDWNDDIEGDVSEYVDDAEAAGDLPVLVAYNIPDRDCGAYSAGGTDDFVEYLEWISGIADGIGSREAWVILEPDATAADCVTNQRLDAIAHAVVILMENTGTSVYIDAGNPTWVPADTMAERLIQAGIAQASGFALNVSNFYTTDENESYGEELSVLVGDKHFVIDTSRNGNGSNGEWCNPPDRHIGANPTTNTNHALVDAWLWVKIPGESDGDCNGGPEAGEWWAEYALGLIL